mmetsp:Transcript_72320/g.204030  ORF Transcript_72320/g.204030 Transcript_72320/m.204030 type:complete len:253 (+) Transcript_72320:262-1020(+)
MYNTCTSESARLHPDVQGDISPLLLGKDVHDDQGCARAHGSCHLLGDPSRTSGPRKVHEQRVARLAHVVLGELGSGVWPHHRWPVQMEVVDELEQRRMPDHHQELSAAEAGEDEAQGLAQRVDAVDVVDEEYALAVGLRHPAHMGGLDVRSAANILVLLALRHFLHEEVQVLDVFEGRAAVQGDLVLATLGKLAQHVAEKGHLRRLPDGFDVTDHRGQRHVQAADHDDVQPRPALPCRVGVSFAAEQGQRLA